jgi:hypothetical protein
MGRIAPAIDNKCVRPVHAADWPFQLHICIYAPMLDALRSMGNWCMVTWHIGTVHGDLLFLASQYLELRVTGPDVSTVSSICRKGVVPFSHQPIK